MDKFDIRTAKFLSIILGICLIFILVVWNAYKYIPQEISTLDPSYESEQQISSEASAMTEEQTSEEQESEADEISEEDIDAPPTNIEPKKIEPLEPISEEEIVENTNSVAVEDKNFDTVLNRAREYKKNKQYSESISEFKMALDSTNDEKLKAVCYEEMAVVYAMSKRYGSAMSAAQRAYNILPTSSREILLARLYYKTGDTERATAKMNNVLRRDFGLYD